MAVSRRALLRGGFTVTAVGALGARCRSPRRGRREPSGSRQPTIHACDEWGARPPNGRITVLEPQTDLHRRAPHRRRELDDFSLAHAFQSRATSRTSTWTAAAGSTPASSSPTAAAGTSPRAGTAAWRSSTAAPSTCRARTSATTTARSSASRTRASTPLWTSRSSCGTRWCSWSRTSRSSTGSRRRSSRDTATSTPPNAPARSSTDGCRSCGTRSAASLGTAVTQPAAAWPLLKPGAQGAKVLAAQHLLRARGANVPTDGVFGTSTFAAVSKLAPANGVAVRTVLRQPDRRRERLHRRRPLAAAGPLGARRRHGDDAQAAAQCC